MRKIANRIRAYFITGLLVVVPVWATYLVLKTLLVAMDGLLGEWVRLASNGIYIPGMGIISLFGFILTAGILAHNIFGRKIVEVWENLLRKVPFVRGVYTTFKAIVDTMSLQSQGQFSKVVLIQFPRKGQYSLAFITGTTDREVQEATPEKVVNVYVPTSPNPTSGYFLLVPEEEIVPLSMSIEDGLKMIVSGGMFSPEAAKKNMENVEKEGASKLSK